MDRPTQWKDLPASEESEAVESEALDMLISVFSDASHDLLTKTGGWGVWITSANGRRYASGAFKVEVNSSTEAEMLASANAIYLALKQSSKGDKLLVQSDCLSGIQMFEGGPAKNPNCRAIVVLVNDWCKCKEVILEWRHVKGHVSGGKSRHWVNNYCDKAARREMRKAKKNIKIGYQVGGLF